MLAIDDYINAIHEVRVTISITELLRIRRNSIRPYEGAATETLERKLKLDAIQPLVREQVRQELELRRLLKK
ncbi:hypothetical protein CFIICLFH_4445 [Methylobacterium goesingense]|nr:hypothetical protein CFIICLFH_4445 [Methylobacterium goesingense]